jgi:hypothetical protein
MEPQNPIVLEGSEPYEYAPLAEDEQEIRLLTLLAVSFGSEIRFVPK